MKTNRVFSFITCCTFEYETAFSLGTETQTRATSLHRYIVHRHNFRFPTVIKINKLVFKFRFQLECKIFNGFNGKRNIFVTLFERIITYKTLNDKKKKKVNQTSIDYDYRR